MESQQIIFGTIDSELQFSFSRSSGPGGQHVNKVNTRAELRFNVSLSKILNEEQKELLFEKLAKQLNQEDEIIIISQATRSQLKNKEDAIEKFYKLINQALFIKKKRKPSKVSRARKEQRLLAKKQQGEKKTMRNWNI